VNPHPDQGACVGGRTYPPLPGSKEVGNIPAGGNEIAVTSDKKKQVHDLIPPSKPPSKSGYGLPGGLSAKLLIKKADPMDA
jgi:hypothetical protein